MVNVPGAFGLYEGFGRTWIDNGDGTYTLRVSSSGGSIGSQSVILVGSTGVLSASLAFPVTVSNQSAGTGSQSIAFPVTLTQPQTVVATNLGTRPLTSASDSVNVGRVGGNPISVSGGTTDNGTQRVVVASDQTLPVSQSGTWTIPSASVVIVGKTNTFIESNSVAYPITVGNTVPVSATNLNIRPLTSASDSVTVSNMLSASLAYPITTTGTATVSGVVTVGNIVPVSATNLGIRPLTSASDSVAATQSGSWAVVTPPGSYDQNAHLVVTTDTYTQKIDYDSSNNPIYVGWALPGTSQSTSTWRLEQIVYSNSTGVFNPVDVRWANGNPLFANAWTNRLSTSFL